VTKIFDLAFTIRNRKGIRNNKDIGKSPCGCGLGARFQRLLKLVTRVGEKCENVYPASRNIQIVCLNNLVCFQIQVGRDLPDNALLKENIRSGSTMG